MEAAAATAGRAVLISGLTVIVAMAGMFFTGDPTFASFGLATMMVAGVAMIASLTVLPAVLSRLGDRVDAGRVPFLGRNRGERGEGRFWGAIVTGVLRRPLLWAVLSGGLLIALAIPALAAQHRGRRVDTLPDTIPRDRHLQPPCRRRSPAPRSPAVVVVEAADVTTPEVRDAIAALGEQALQSGQMHEPIDVAVNDDRNGRADRHPDRRRWQRRGVELRARHAPRADRPRHGGGAARRADRCHGRHRPVAATSATR